MTEHSVTERARQIRLLLLDVDGVLSDGKLYYTANGDEIKTFHTQDGHGIKTLRKAGVETGIISGRKSPMVERRAAELGIPILVQGREDKFAALKEVLTSQHYTLEQIAFMGDDWPDLLVMQQVGLALTVANAHPSVLKRAHWVAARNGGEGAVREACDWLMQQQGTLEAALTTYLQGE